VTPSSTTPSPRATTSEPAAETTATPPPPGPAAPAPPAVTAPAAGGSTVIAANALTVAGTGQAGARILVSAVAAGGQAITETTLGRIPVGGDGTWSAAVDCAQLADGPATLSFTQVQDQAPSAPVARTVAFDRRADPPTIDTLDTGNGAFTGYLDPIVEGTAEPGATVEIRVDGTGVASTTARADGTWSSSPLSGLGTGQHTLTARQTDVAANVSAPTSANFRLRSPELNAQGGAQAITIGLSGPGGLGVTISGEAGPWQTVTLPHVGNWTETYQWASVGEHTFGAAASDGQRTGPRATQRVTIH
jgi:hypothetical protein